MGGDLAAIGLVCLVAIVVFSVPFAAAALLGRYLGIVVASFAGTVMAGTIVLPFGSSPYGEIYRRDIGPPADLPPVIHLILDEQIGIAGLPGDIEGSEDLRRDLRKFYGEFGFTLFERAYSTYSQTEYSLKAMLNGRHRYQFDGAPGSQDSGEFFRNNLWFKVLADRGYQVRLHHPALPNYCGKDWGKIFSCYVYPDNSLRNLIDADLPTATSTRVI